MHSPLLVHLPHPISCLFPILHCTASQSHCHSHFKAATGSAPVRQNKWKAENDEQGSVSTVKKLKPNNAEAAEYSLGPMSLV